MKIINFFNQKGEELKNNGTLGGEYSGIIKEQEYYYLHHGILAKGDIIVYTAKEKEENDYRTELVHQYFEITLNMGGTVMYHAVRKYNGLLIGIEILK